jgi:urease subunit gamma/beta
MHLTPHEIEKLMLHTAGSVAQKRLARGLRLNYPEAVALIATVTLELIRDGNSSVTQLMDTGQKLLGKNQVLRGVPEMATDVHIEGTFPDGTKLVAIRNPITADDGDLALALYGTFLPIPSLAVFKNDPSSTDFLPGEYFPAEGDLTLNEGRPATDFPITNTSTRPIQIGSHFHLVEANPRLHFDRALAFGQRLDIPAGAAIRFEPGETRTVSTVPIAGRKIIRGGNTLTDGPVSDASKSATLDRVKSRNFASKES